MRTGRHRLRELRSELEGWRDVPPSARSFHRALRVLEEDLEAQKGRIFPWGAGEVVIELEERAGRLRPVAEGLRGLFERRQEAESLLTDVDNRSRGEAGSEQADLSRWRVALARVGESVRSIADLEIERRQLEDLWGELVAARDRARLGSTRVSAPTSAASSHRTPPSSDPPKVASGDPERDPRTTRDRAALHRLEELGRHLWDWARFVPGHGEAISAISSRKESATAVFEEGGQEGEPIADVLAAAEALLIEITAEAAEERRGRQEGLESRLQTLSSLIVYPDLEARAEALFARSVEDARAHKAWLAQWDEVADVLRDRLHNDHRRVAEAFDGAVQDLRQSFGGIDRRLLGEETASILEGLAAEMRESSSATGVEERFEALDRLRAVRNELTTWSRRAREEQAAYHERRDGISARIHALETAAQALDSFRLAADLAGARKAEEAREADEDAEASLEAAQKRLDSLEARLNAEESRFAAACAAKRRRLAERDRGLASLLDVAVTLELLDSAAVPSAREGPRGQNPAAAAVSLEAARNRREQLEASFEEASASAVERLMPALAELENLEQARLRPGERRERATLIAEAAGFDPESRSSSLGSLASDEWRSFEDLLGWLRRQTDLIDRIEGDRRRAAERRHQLVQRLEDLERDRLAEVCPKPLVVRAHALVHGLGEVDLEHPASAEQLTKAETLLERLETHARSLLAVEVEHARERLAGDPSPQARAVLAELSTARTDELPPPPQRQRLFHLVPDENRP